MGLPFKVATGYGKSEFIRIDESEVDAALWAFKSEGKVMFENGVCRGKDIISVKEDYNGAMGWNDTHTLEDDDWNEIRREGVDRKYRKILAEAKDRVDFLSSVNRPDLLGKAKTVEELKELASKKMLI